jgi:hypothetical protein
MIVRFYTDPDGSPHVMQHGVTPEEAIEILRGAAYHGPAKNGARAAEGQTHHGRYLRVIYRQDEVDGIILVITAYDLSGKAKTAYRRRRRKRS